MNTLTAFKRVRTTQGREPGGSVFSATPSLCHLGGGGASAAYELLCDERQRRMYDSVDDVDDTIPSPTEDPKTFFRSFGAAFARNSRCAPAFRVALTLGGIDSMACRVGCMGWVLGPDGLSSRPCPRWATSLRLTSRFKAWPCMGVAKEPNLLHPTFDGWGGENR